MARTDAHLKKGHTGGRCRIGFDWEGRTMNDYTVPQAAHRLELDGRESLTVSGVEDEIGRAHV